MRDLNPDTLDNMRYLHTVEIHGGPNQYLVTNKPVGYLVPKDKPQTVFVRMQIDLADSHPENAVAELASLFNLKISVDHP